MQTAEIHIAADGIEIVNGPLVAGEPVPVAVDASALALAEDAALTLVLSSRAPNAPLSTAVLERGDGDAWTGTLDTATRQAAVFFAAAAADETRPVALELIDTAHRDSLFVLASTLRNSALIPSAPCAVAPVYLPVPGKQGEPGADGQAATVSVGTTTTIPAGSAATVTNVGTETDAVLNFAIPRGADGTFAGFAVNLNPDSSGAIVYVKPNEITAFSAADYPNFTRIESKNFPVGALAALRVANPRTASAAIEFSITGNKTISIEPGHSYNAILTLLAKNGSLIVLSETNY